MSLPQPDSDAVDMARYWFSYSDNYLNAAGQITGGGEMTLPRVQLMGHAVECSLKAYLHLLGEENPRTHDLTSLTKRAVGHGLSLTEKQLERIELLNGAYFVKDGSWKYPARYPDSTSGTKVFVTPTHEWIQEVCSSISGQALP